MGTYQPKVYRKQGGDELVVASGGKINIESGGTLEADGTAITAADLKAVGAFDGLTASVAELNIMDGVTATAAEISKLHGAGAVVASGTAHAHIADAKVDYTTGDLDAEAEIIAAVNATNGKINDILAALLAFGIMAPTE